MIEQVKGTRNIHSDEAQVYLFIFNTFLNTFNSSGYEYTELPIIEHKELFTKSIGESSEIVTKQMYEFKDKGNRELVLRPEGTASVVRFHNEFYKNDSKKYSYFGKMYRYENPQKNRYREFHQAGAEIIGTIDIFSDLQIIQSSIRFLNTLGIKADLHINSIGTIDDRTKYVSELFDYLIANKENLSKDSQDKLENNTLRVLDSNNSEDKDVISKAPSILGYLNDDSLNNYLQIKKELDSLGIEYIEDSNLVRGLDYYNDLTFEFKVNGLAVGGGGRYDKLSQILKLGNSEGIGVAFGVDRLMSLINKDAGKKTKISLIGSTVEIINEISSELTKNKINHILPVRISKENTQYKYAVNNKSDIVINCNERTIKLINSKETFPYNIDTLRDLI
jgi:histidyl-tRNA synthetase